MSMIKKWFGVGEGGVPGADGPSAPTKSTQNNTTAAANATAQTRAVTAARKPSQPSSPARSPPSGKAKVATTEATSDTTSRNITRRGTDSLFENMEVKEDSGPPSPSVNQTSAFSFLQRDTASPPVEQASVAFSFIAASPTTAVTTAAASSSQTANEGDLFGDLEVKVNSSGPAIAKTEKTPSASNVLKTGTAASSPATSVPTTPQSAVSESSNTSALAVANKTAPKKKKKLQVFEFQKQSASSTSGGDDEEVADIPEKHGAIGAVATSPVVSVVNQEDTSKIESIDEPDPVEAETGKSPPAEEEPVKVEEAAQLTVADKLQQLDERLQQLETEQHLILQQLEGCCRQTAEINILLRKTEDQQVAAGEGEDFVLAERLNDEIERHHAELVLLNKQLPQLNDSLSRVQQHKLDLTQEQLRLVASYSEDLESKLRVEQEAVLSIKQEIASKKQKEQNKINAERDRLDRFQSHIKLDLDLVEKADAALREKIRLEGKDLFEEQEQLTARKDEITAEIAELLRRLAILQAEQQSIESKLDTVKASIAATAENHSEERARIDAEALEIGQRRAEYEEAFTALSTAERTLASALETLVKSEESHHQQSEAIKALKLELQNKTKHYQDRQKVIENYCKDVLRKQTAYAEQSKELERLNRIVEETEEAARQQSALVLSHETALNDKQLLLASLRTKIVQWDQQKKVVVAERNFKEAGRLANEIKTAQATLDDGEKELVTLQQVLNDAQGQLQTTRQQLKDHRSSVATVERQGAQEQLALLEPELNEMKAQYQRIAQDSSKFDEATLLRARIVVVAANVVLLRARYGNASDLVTSKIMDAFNIGPDPVRPVIKSDVQQIAASLISKDDQVNITSTESTVVIREAALKIVTEAGTPLVEPTTIVTSNATAGEPQDALSKLQQWQEAKTRFEFLQARQKQLDTEIEKAAEQEDYDLADKLNSELQQLQAELAQIEAFLTENNFALVESGTQESVFSLAADDDDNDDDDDGADDEPETELDSNDANYAISPQSANMIKSFDYQTDASMPMSPTFERALEQPPQQQQQPQDFEKAEEISLETDHSTEGTVVNDSVESTVVNDVVASPIESASSNVVSATENNPTSESAFGFISPAAEAKNHSNEEEEGGESLFDDLEVKKD